MAQGKYKDWLSPEGLLILSAWARDGLTDEQLAKKMNISASTLYEWKNRYPEISEAIKNAKNLADARVEDSLYKKCLGYEVLEDRAFKCRQVYYDDNGRRCEKEEVEVVQVSRHVPADIMAIAIWLNNRCKEKWGRNPRKEQLDRERLELDKKMAEERNW